VIERWDRFWFEEVPPHIYALLRISLGGLGVLGLLHLADARFWDLGTGLIGDLGLPALKSALRARELGAVSGWLLYAFCLAAFVAMTLGFKSRISVGLALASQLAQVSWNSLPLSGAHHTTQILLFCLIWADTGAVWSIDAWLERRRGIVAGAPARAVIAPLRLIRYQIALIYFMTGVWKLGNPTWRDGSALHYVLNNNVYHRFPALASPGIEWLATVSTYATLFWELAFAVMLLWRPTRYLALALGVMFHLGILVTIEVGGFNFVMLAAYLAFLDPQTVSRLDSRILRYRSRLSPPTVPAASIVVD
jgi:hypothetical protein